MDGTREFVDGRVLNVQCFIGITHRGRPVAGVIGLPFFGSGDGREEMVGRIRVPVVCALDWKGFALVEQLDVGKGGGKGVQAGG